PDRMHREEIDRNELRNVVMEKCLPLLRWRFPVADHIFRDRSLGDLFTQFHQFASNPRCAPDDVFPAHGSNQITSLFRNCRPSGPAATNLPRPVPSESLPMPTDDGFRVDDNQGGTPSGPQTRQPNPEPPIGTIK